MKETKSLSIRRFIKMDSLAIILALSIEIIIFGVASPYFFTTGNLLTIVQYCSLVGLVAMPMTLLMISGNFDMSLGSQVALTSCVAGLICHSSSCGWGTVLLGLLAAMGIGAVCGFLNAFFIMKVNLPAFIATMAMMQALRGVAYLITNGSSIMLMSPVFGVLGRGKMLGIPNTIYILVVFVAIFAFIAKYTVFGRRAYTIGGNSSAARLSGINVNRTTTILYVLTSITTGLVGVLSASQLGAALPAGNADFAFDVISAVVLGGVAMSGGKGTIFGSVIGVLVLAILDNGLIMLNVSSHWQLVCSGVVLLLAVSIDALKQKRVSGNT